MHIKKITIQGFKTYRNTTVVDELSDDFNVVVGRNGSGKSNFFAAIRFVLSDAYTHMTREERQALIHEDSGLATVMSAYVEIVFDNSDKRFPLQSEEVAIRRTIGLKKDDYSLDGRSVTRSDAMNLLESAGFSRLNPYYIVPQGKITALTNSKDSERLALLKEVSGAKVFEAKLRESTKEMENSNYKMQRIDESMERLEEKVQDLQLETDDLKEYQQYEKGKKIYEYNLLDRELKDLETQNETIGDSYETLMAQSKKDIEKVEEREKNCAELEKEIKEIENSLMLANLESQHSESDYSRLTQTIAEKDAAKTDLKASTLAAETEAQEKQQTRDKYTALVNLHETELHETLKPRLDQLQSKEKELKEKLSDLHFVQSSIYAKQDRFLKFTTREERDAWLNKQIDRLQAQITHKKSQHDNAQNDVSRIQEELIEIKNSVEDIRGQVDKSGNSDELEHKLEKLRVQVVSLSEQRKKTWRDEIRLRSMLDSANVELSSATHKVNQTMDQSQAEGLREVQLIAERLGLQDSVYGPLAELFGVSDKYKTAVEVIAGSSLFHVVVDTDETALILIKELMRLKKGRVTFMPLNRLHPPAVTFPDPHENEFIPLIKKIRHDDEVAKAVQHVFGRTIVCKDLVRGSELARTHRLTAITLEGDRASNRGVMTGGFRDYKNSRMDALRLQAKKKREVKKLEDQIKQNTKQVQDIEKQLAECNKDLDSGMRELESTRQGAEASKSELSRVLARKFGKEKELNSARGILENTGLAQKSLSSKIAQYSEEKASAFTQALSDEEIAKLNEGKESIRDLETQLSEIVGEVTGLETRIAQVESEMSKYNAHLVRLDDINDSLSGSQDFVQLQFLEAELTKLTKRLENMRKEMEKNKTQINKLNEQLSKKKSELQKENEKQISVIKKIESVSKKTESLLSKRALLETRKEEVQQKISELGVLPEEAFQESVFEGISLNELMAKLHEANNELKKYSHVNKKALEQFNLFTKEKEALEARKQELEQSKTSIENLMQSLEQQKDSAIIKSFEQVSRSFSEIFGKLVPNGAGELVMRKKEDGQSDAVENYTGVSISVSFNSRHDEQQRIEQLSGGQKSLCAIALILAIQKSDPAPFYLFDEIDANLDTQYRSAVARIIQNLSKNAQFICTTFRPEMLQLANKFYGVSFNDKVSTISVIERDDALTFVEGQK